MISGEASFALKFYVKFGPDRLNKIITFLELSSFIAIQLRPDGLLQVRYNMEDNDGVKVQETFVLKNR